MLRLPRCYSRQTSSASRTRTVSEKSDEVACDVLCGGKDGSGRNSVLAPQEGERGVTDLLRWEKLLRPARLASLAFGRSVTAVEAFDAVGVSKDHQCVFQHYADANQCAIGIRYVNPAARDRIRDGLQSKNFHIKAKTATEGPMAGLIPVDQSLSKVRTRGPEAVRAANAKITRLLTEQSASGRHREMEWAVGPLLVKPRAHARGGPVVKAEPGIVSRIAALYGLQAERGVKRARGGEARAAIVASQLWLSREAFLAARYGDLPEDGSTREFTLRFGDGAERTLMGHRAGNRIYLNVRPFDGQNNHFVPLQVVCYQRGTEEPEWITADYDLWGLIPFVTVHGPEDGRPLPLITYQEHRRRTSPLHSRHELNSAEEVAAYLAAENVHLGNASKRVERLISELWSAFSPRGGRARPMIHHSDDLHNPFSNEADNYPVLLFLPHFRLHQNRPTDLAYQGGMRILQGPDDGMRALEALRLVGFIATPHPDWRGNRDH